MRILTNAYQDCELLNLGFNKNGRGPYVIRQDGIPPDSLEAQEDRFLLRKDGTWVLNITVYTLSEGRDWLSGKRPSMAGPWTSQARHFETHQKSRAAFRCV